TEVNIDFVEKDSDTLQISIQSLVNKINIRNILEVWALQPLTKAANVWYLPESDHSQHNYKIINECRFYGELWELAITDKKDEEDEDNEENEKNKEHEEDDNDEVLFDLQNLKETLKENDLK
ncbi:13563_t:CDS:2, partial [Gigaspora rosea]